MPLLHLTLGVLLAAAASTALAQTERSAPARGPSMTGVVKAVSPATLTIERDGAEVLFSVTAATRLFGRGMRGPGDYPNGARDLVGRPAPRLPDLLKPGERVTVRFQPSGSVLRALEVRILPPR